MLPQRRLPQGGGPKEKDRPSVPEVAFTLDGAPGDAARLKAQGNNNLHFVVDHEGNLAIFTNEAKAEAHVKQLPASGKPTRDVPAVETRTDTSAEANIQTLYACYPPLSGYTTLHDYANWCGAIVDLNADVGDLWYKGFDNRATSIDNWRSTKTRYFSGYYKSGYSFTLAPYSSIKDLSLYGWSNIISSVDVNAW